MDRTKHLAIVQLMAFCQGTQWAVSDISITHAVMKYFVIFDLRYKVWKPGVISAWIQLGEKRHREPSSVVDILTADKLWWVVCTNPEDISGDQIATLCRHVVAESLHSGSEAIWGYHTLPTADSWWRRWPILHASMCIDVIEEKWYWLDC